MGVAPPSVLSAKNLLSSMFSRLKVNFAIWTQITAEILNVFTMLVHQAVYIKVILLALLPIPVYTALFLCSPRPKAQRKKIGYINVRVYAGLPYGQNGQLPRAPRSCEKGTKEE